MGDDWFVDRTGLRPTRRGETRRFSTNFPTQGTHSWTDPDLETLHLLPQDLIRSDHGLDSTVGREYGPSRDGTRVCRGDFPGHRGWVEVVRVVPYGDREVQEEGLTPGPYRAP